MTRHDKVDDILNELAEIHGLRKEEIKIESLPSMRTVSLPPLKYRAKHLIDNGRNHGAKLKKNKKKYKRESRPYIRSSRLQERAMTKNQAITHAVNYGFHLDCFAHIEGLAEAPRCLMCDLPPRTIGDYIYSSFTPYYKCEVCFSIKPYSTNKDTNPNSWIFNDEYARKKRQYNVWSLRYLKHRINKILKEDTRWL